MLISQELNQSALDEWVEYRRATKKPLKEYGLKATIKMMLKYDFDTQQEMVDKSMRNEWQGLFEPKLKDSKVEEPGFIEKHLDTSWADGL